MLYPCRIQNIALCRNCQKNKNQSKWPVGEHRANFGTKENTRKMTLKQRKQNKVIAHDLGLSPRTVEVYRANVMTKMNVDSLPELIRKALAAGAT